MSNTDIFFDRLHDELPPVFTREFAAEKTGNIFSAKTLSNIDSSGTGPSVKVRIGKKVGYERESFIQWLKNKVKSDGCCYVKNNFDDYHMPDTTRFRKF